MIDILHSLRCVSEKNSTLQYLFLSDLHKWHSHAFKSLAESMLMSKTLKVVNLKNCTHDCYSLMQDIAPNVKF